MANWYMKGQSEYVAANFHMGFYIDHSGFPEGDYDTRNMESHGQTSDPFMAFGVDTGPATWTYGQQQVEIGLLKSHRIKFDTTGVYKWVGPGQDDWQILDAGGMGPLNDLTDVVITGTPADNEVLAYDNGTSKWINQTAAEAGLATTGDLHSESHVLATTGPHTGTLPWTDLSKTGSSLADLATRAHSNLSDAPADAHHAKQHAMDDITQHTRTDIAVLDASTSFHGFLKKLDNVATNFMNGQGNWSVPAGTYSLEQHDNTYHSTNYHTEADGAGVVTVHSDITSAGSGIIITTLERGDIHAQSHAFDSHTNPTGSIVMNTQKFTGMAAGTENGNSVRYEQLHEELHDINSHNDVTITGPAESDILQCASGVFVDRTLAEAGIAAAADLHNEAHVLATTGPHTGSLPLTDIASWVQGSIIKGGATDWEALGLGTENYVLKAGATDIAWGQVAWGEVTGKPTEFTPISHNNTYHSTNYHSEADGTGVVTVHSDITSAGSGIIITTAERNALHPAVTEVYNLKALDDRDFKPNTSVSWLFVKAYFTTLEGMTGAAGTDYQDLLILNTYSDGSGGDMNALTFDKSEKLIKHWLADQTAGTWGTPKTLAYVEDTYTQTQVDDKDGAVGDRFDEQSTTFPGSPSEGDVHYDEDDDSWYRYNGEPNTPAWVEVGAGGGVAAEIDNLGNHTATEDLDMGTFRIINQTYVAENPTERNTTSLTYVKLKEITANFYGSLTVAWKFYGTSGFNQSSTRIYKNGVALGSINNTFSTSYITMVESVAGIEPDDLIQIYAKRDNAYLETVYVKDFIFLSNPYGTINESY